MEEGTLTSPRPQYEKQENGKKYHRVERAYGSFGRASRCRTTPVPKVTADFKEGVLKVHLAKNEKARPQQVESASPDRCSGRRAASPSLPQNSNRKREYKWKESNANNIIGKTNSSPAVQPSSPSRVRLPGRYRWPETSTNGNTGPRQWRILVETGYSLRASRVVVCVTDVLLRNHRLLMSQHPEIAGRTIQRPAKRVPPHHSWNL